MSTPFDQKHYDKDQFHQGAVPAETMVSMHYSEVILKLLEQIGKGDVEAIKKVVDRLLQTCKDQGSAIDYLKEKLFELQNGRKPTDYGKYKYNKESTAKKTSSSSNAVWTRDKYGNVVKKSELRSGSSYPKEFYQHHYGVSYNPRNPPSCLR